MSWALGEPSSATGSCRRDWRPVSRPADGGVNEERLALGPRDDHGFYRNLADHLAWDEPLAVRPEEARRTVAVMEAATRSIAAGGTRLEVDI